MQHGNLYRRLFLHGRKQVFPLIDPDKTSEDEAIQTGRKAQKMGLNAILVGGSLLTEGNMDTCIRNLKKHFTNPVLLFPGSILQLSREADGILFISLISGRNPELLIGQHVAAAPQIRSMNLEPISTGYMLIDCGKSTSVAYMSQTFPIPYTKHEIAASTALAGEMLGLQCIYLEGGSGAEKPVSPEMIKKVSDTISIPLIVGGGITDEVQAEEAFAAGAQTIIVGNILEKSPEMLNKMVSVVNRLNSSEN